MQVYINMLENKIICSDKVEKESRQRAETLLAYINHLTGVSRLTSKSQPRHQVPECIPLVLVALMQHRLGNLDTQGLVDMLEAIDTLAVMWVLCGVYKSKRISRKDQVRSLTH